MTTDIHVFAQDGINARATVSMRGPATAGWPLVTEAVEILPAGAVETDHDLWLKTRHGGLGGSDIAAVVGANPWHTPYEVWMDKTGRSDGRDDAYAMRRGRYFEPALCQWFADQTGIATRRTGTWARRDAPWMRCNPDRFTGDGYGLEVKQPASEWAAQWRGGPAKYALVQGLWGCAVTGLPGWYLAADVAQGRAAQLPVWWLDAHRCAQWIAYLVEFADWWWHRYVVGDRPPPVDGSEALEAALKATFRGPVTLGGMVELPGLRARVERRRELKKVIKSAERELREVENWIRAGLEYDETGCEDGVPLIAWAPVGNDPDDPTLPAHRAFREIKG